MKTKINQQTGNITVEEGQRLFQIQIMELTKKTMEAQWKNK